jgi:dienelactone hydrolase
MLREFSLLLALFVVDPILGSSRFFGPQETRTVLPAGVVIPRVEAAADAKQSYALYLPSKYSREKRWPIVYVFDPLARGQLALEQFQHAAELYGYIVAASNNSRNGPWPPELEAANAVFRDTQERFSVDPARIYFAGFSGGARVSSQLAQICKCAAGVILSGAGFSFASQPTADAKFAVFSAVGNADFNYSEVVPLQEKLEKATLAHWLRVFEGSHEWAPPSVLNEALAWFRVQSMKSYREPRDEVFLAAQFAAAQERASGTEKSGDLLAAWREFRQVAEAFDGLRDVSTVRAKVEELEKRKDFRDAAKHERNDFAEQARLSDEILSAAAVKKSDDSSPTATSEQAKMLTRDLRSRAEHEKKPDRAVVLKRALGGVFIGSIESGSEALDKKDYNLAARFFACAAEANPESEWALRDLAVARAFSGDRKGALEALRSARKLSKDLPGFSEWLHREPAFERLKKIADFDSLTSSS